MWEAAKTRDRRQQRSPGFKDHLGSSLPELLMVQYTVESTHPALGSAKLNHMEMPKILTDEFLARFVPSSVCSIGMQWAHEGGMKVEQGHVAKRRDARLSGGRKKVIACAVFRMGLDAVCVFTYSNQRTGWTKDRKSSSPPVVGCTSCVSHLIKLGKASWRVLFWDHWSLNPPYLVHTVQELEENRCEAASLAAGTQVATLAELVAKGQPLFLQQHLETL